MATSDKLTYLNETKQKIKEAINNTKIVEITNEPFRQYVNKIGDIQSKYEKYLSKVVIEKEGSDSTLNLDKALNYDIVSMNIYGKSEQGTKLLPEEYTQVEYIESTSYIHNSNYIDTEIKPTNNTSIEIKANGPYNSYDRWFGSSDLFRNQINSSGQCLVYWNGTYLITESIINRIVTLKLDKNKLYIDGNLSQTYSQGTFSDSNNLRLFSATTGDKDGIVKIYNAKVWESDILVRNFVPCYRNSDNSVGMYDLVNNKFYENKGTVKFNYGNIVNIPSPEYPSEIKTVKGIIDSFGKSWLKVNIANDNQEQEVLIDMNKLNLFDKDNMNIINGFFYVGSVINSSNNAKTFYIPITPGGTYTISKTLGALFRIGTTKDLPDIGVKTLNVQIVDDLRLDKYTIIASNEANYLMLYYYNKNSDTLPEQEIINSISIYEGTNADPYYELVSINDVQDELEVVSGNLTKKIEKIESYNGEIITTDYISTTGKLTNGATVYYILEKPQTIQLTPTKITLKKGTNITTLEDEENIKTTLKSEYIADGNELIQE